MVGGCIIYTLFILFLILLCLLGYIRYIHVISIRFTYLSFVAQFGCGCELLSLSVDGGGPFWRVAQFECPQAGDRVEVTQFKRAYFISPNYRLCHSCTLWTSPCFQLHTKSMRSFNITTVMARVRIWGFVCEIAWTFSMKRKAQNPVICCLSIGSANSSSLQYFDGLLLIPDVWLLLITRATRTWILMWTGLLAFWHRCLCFMFLVIAI